MGGIGCATIHHDESLTFSLWRITGAVNGWPAGDATRPHRSGGAWSDTVAVTPRAGRLWAFQDGYAWRWHGYVCGNATVTRTPSRNQ